MTSVIFQLSCLLVIASFIPTSSSLKRDDCEVCFSVLETFPKTLTDAELKDPKQIEAKFKVYCKNIKGKENRFCYYVGGHEDSATGILGEMSKPLSWGMPADKVCEKLKKMDAQICDLRFEKTIDLSTVDLKKLKTRDLKKILSGWDEECDGCIEMGDYIKRIEALKPKYVRTEL